jgi:hypothetical protein
MPVRRHEGPPREGTFDRCLRTSRRNDETPGDGTRPGLSSPWAHGANGDPGLLRQALGGEPQLVMTVAPGADAPKRSRATRRPCSPTHPTIRGVRRPRRPPSPGSSEEAPPHGRRQVGGRSRDHPGEDHPRAPLLATRPWGAHWTDRLRIGHGPGRLGLPDVRDVRFRSLSSLWRSPWDARLSARRAGLGGSGLLLSGPWWWSCSRRSRLSVAG